MYCGVIGSSNSVAAGSPMSATSSSTRLAIRKPVAMSKVSSNKTNRDQLLPADYRARLFETNTHDHQQKLILHAIS